MVCGPDVRVFHRVNIVYASECAGVCRRPSHMLATPCVRVWLTVLLLWLLPMPMCVWWGGGIRVCECSGLASGPNHGGGVALVQGWLVVVWMWIAVGCLDGEYSYRRMHAGTHARTHTHSHTHSHRLAGTVLACE